jgi:hypothetical protein
LDSGYDGGSWNHAGIISSAAAANPGYAVAYADGSKDSGTPAQPNQVLLKYDLIGDTNLDGTVNLTDLLALLNSYGQSGKDWAHGDLNYDGTVNLTDLLELLNNYGGVSSNTSISLPAASNSANNSSPAPAATTSSATPASAIVASAPAVSTPIGTDAKTVSPEGINPIPIISTTLFSDVPITTDSDILSGNSFGLP